MSRGRRAAPRVPEASDYVYDPAGNRTLRSESGALTTSVYDAANQLLTESSAARSVSYTYDRDGHRAAQDDTAAGVTHYSWNDQGLRASAEPRASCDEA